MRGEPETPATARTLAASVWGVSWRLGLYFALLAGGVVVLSRGVTLLLHLQGAHFSHSAGERPVEELALAQLIVLAAAAAATLVLVRADRQAAPSPLPLHRNAAPHFAQGLAWGLIGVGATMAAIAALGGYQVRVTALSASGVAYYAPLWIAASIANGFAENLALLGYPFQRIVKLVGFAPAILAVGLLFSASHLGNAGENPLGLASLFLVGALLAAAVWLTGDLWLSIGIHAGAVFAEDFLFSVPDSGVSYTGRLLRSQFAGPDWLTGGTAGPEGSLVAFPVFAAVFAILWLVYRGKAPAPKDALGSASTA